MKKALKNFFKSIIAGCIGAGVLLMVSIFVFFIVKLIYYFMQKDLLLSKYNIMTAIVLFMFVGFIYGISSFRRSNSYRKLLKPTWTTFLTNFIISALFAFGTYMLFRERYSSFVGIEGLILLFVLLFVLFWLFSAILANYLTPKKTRIKTHKARNAILFILFNPIFIMIYLWLFGVVSYNSVYIPCTVIITGVDKNPNTANTINLGIKSGETIISIDDNKISSLQDVRDYINSLQTTKQVTLETDKNIYYIRTYEVDGNRYMGLLLRQEYCERKYI